MRAVRFEDICCDGALRADAGSRSLSAVVSASADVSQGLQFPAGTVSGGRELTTDGGFVGFRQAAQTLSALSSRPEAEDDCPGAVFPPEGSELAKPAPRCGIPAVLTAPLQAELGELVYIGQGATGLVYRASVMWPCDAAGVEAPLVGPVSVAVKFMICNTPQQLWQRAKEALLSKLVSHPNLVRTLAMEVTLVTPNTFHEWGERQTACIDATGLAAHLGPGMDGPPTPTISATARAPVGSLGSATEGGAAAVGAPAGGAGSGAEAGAAVADATTIDPDNSHTITAVVEGDLLAAVPQVRGRGPLCAPIEAPAAEPLADGAPPGAGDSSSSSQSARAARALGSVTAVAAAAMQGGFAEAGSGGGGGHIAGAARAAAESTLGSIVSEGPCTVTASEVWAGCCGSSVMGVSNMGAPSTVLERSWPHPGESGSGSGGGGSRAACAAAAGGKGGALVRLRMSSGLMMGSGGGTAGNGGGEGGSGSDGCPGYILSASGDCESANASAKPEAAALRCDDDGVAAAVGAAAAAAAPAVEAENECGGAGHGAIASTAPPPAMRQQPLAGMAVGSLSVPAASGRTLLGADAAAVAAALEGLRPQVAGGPGVGLLADPVGAPQLGGAGGGGSGGGGSSQGGGGGGGGSSRRSGPVPFQDILYHMDALPGRFLAKVIMEYCDSGTLLQRINAGDFVAHPDKGPLAMLSALRVLLWCLQEVAAGMAHLHSLNIIHGDLKPGNVLLTTQAGSPLGYVCKVSDFGLATALEASEQTITHENWGTVVYMAPESCAGRCRKASDVYSFGVLLWQMATGERPYAGMQAGQVLLGVKTGTLKLQWPGWVNKSLVKVGQACLRFEPKERPGFKGIRSALAKIAVRLDQKIAVVESAGAGQGPGALLQSTTSSALAPPLDSGMDGGGGEDP